MFEQALIALPLLIGAYISFSLMKVPDLSIESAFVFGATLAVSFQGPAGLFGGALIGGALVGLTTGVLNQVFRLPILLASILTNGLFHGLTQLTLGTAIYSFSNRYNPLNLLPFGELGMLIAVGVVLCFVIGLFLKTQLGLSYAIYGDNPSFFGHYRISTRFVVLSGLVVANACAGLSGYLFAQSNGFVDLTMGFGTILLCLTALVLGKMVVRLKHPTVLVPIVGVLLFFALQYAVLRVGLNLKYFNAFQAILVLGALIMMRKKEHLPAIDHLGV